MPDIYRWQTSPLDVTLERLRDQPELAIDLAYEAMASHVPEWRGYAEWVPSRVLSQAHELVMRTRRKVSPGPWHGLPVSAKDNIGVAGWKLCAGSQRSLPTAWQRDAAITARLRQAGAVFTGMTHSVPFCFTSLGVTLDGEGPRNPWDSERVCGGSSSGAAVSVAEGSAWLALGSDTAGSVRVPAAMTGVVGLKMTHGRWPAAGVVPLSHTLDSLGLLARSAADLAAGLGALEGGHLAVSKTATLAGLRLGVLQGEPRESADPGIDDTFNQALRELETAGARLSDLTIPETAEADALFRSGGVVAAELEAFLSLHLPAWRRGLAAPLDSAMARASELPAAIYHDRLVTLHRLARRASSRLAEAGVAALVLPTSPMTPPKRDSIASAVAYTEADDRILRHTAFLNYLQWCAVSLPVGMDAAGLPVGLQLAMPGFEESRLLEVALSIERCLGTPRHRLGMPTRPS